MDTFDLDPRGYLPLLRAIAEHFGWLKPPAPRVNHACCT